MDDTVGVDDTDGADDVVGSTPENGSNGEDGENSVYVVNEANDDLGRNDIASTGSENGTDRADGVVGWTRWVKCARQTSRIGEKEQMMAMASIVLTALTARAT